MMQAPGTSVHWYGKEVQNKRKLGHITIVGPNNETAQQRLRFIDAAAADALDAASQAYAEATSGESTSGKVAGQPHCA